MVRAGGDGDLPAGNRAQEHFIARFGVSPPDVFRQLFRLGMSSSILTALQRRSGRAGPLAAARKTRGGPRISPCQFLAAYWSSWAPAMGESPLLGRSSYRE